MKRTIKLNESELRRMINESVMGVLNEAYGTPSKADIKKNDNLYFGSSDGETLRDNNDRYDATATLIDRICRGFSMVMNEIHTQGFNEPYSKKLYDLASKGYKIANLWKNKEIMKLGQQPDYGYDMRHAKPDYSYLSDPNYIQAQERAFGA